PVLLLDGLQLGIDNMRHDVWLSPAVTTAIGRHIANLLVHYGNVGSVITANPASAADLTRNQVPKLPPIFASKHPDLKQLLTELQKCPLNRAKAEQNPTIDLLGRAATIKFLRAELNNQFAAVLERCRATLKAYEGVRQHKSLEYRETVASYLVRKKHILRQAGQELFRTLRQIDREMLAPMRRCFFGEKHAADYQVFLNRLIFLEEGRDSYLQAEHYVLTGGFENDPDSLGNVRALLYEFLKTVVPESDSCDTALFEGWISAPENAHELVGSGESAERGQKERLEIWTELLERDGLLGLALAAYEVLPLLREFTPLLDPQQLKYALIMRKQREQVEQLVEAHGKLSLGKIAGAAARVSESGAPQRTKVAARFLRDFMLYYRDLRRLELLNQALERINLVSSQRLSELSKVNGTLYDFLLPEESRSERGKSILRHVVVKADVRDSSRVTRSLAERGMNPASYFSLNFYDPVTKLLAKYGARKVFVEGDAIIAAILERDGEPELSVSRACVLAREVLDLVGGYNHLLERAGLPALELGIGISYQNCSPTYLLDGEHQIMISEALNESDRLSACDKRMCKAMVGLTMPFNAYEFRASGDPELEPMRFNVGGIRISEAAFNRIGEEISLAACSLEFPRLWGSEEASFYSGLVPVSSDVFRRLVIRRSRIPLVEASTFNFVQWTGGLLYEVCTQAAVYNTIEKTLAATT
ncbi:MAG: hypothetical protein JO356_08825, partial [Acidobacteria bacterium]|nr:hypothetical protein [Acidobacteriota bacterium]